MSLYRYKARDKAGQLREGTMEADLESAVAVKLQEMGCLPISIVPAKPEQKFFKNFLDQFNKVKFTDLNLLTRQLYTLQKAGIPLLSGLYSLKEQTANRILKDILEKVAKDIEAGLNFSSALERHPKVFTALYVNMIRTGEASGRLAEILERLSILGEHDETIRLKIKGALRYPAIVLTTIVLGFLTLVTFIMPKFQSLYNQFTTPLPLPTQILLGINYVLRRLWWLILLLGGGFVTLARQYLETPPGLLWWDTFKLRIPIFGPLILKLSMSRFCRITGILIKSGIPILQILELVSKSVGNAALSRIIDEIKESVNEGKGMLAPMKKSSVFPPIVIQMIAIGEETGKLDDLLLHVSDYYDEQVDHTIANLVSLIEPILIFILGFMVLFMALGVFLPVWSLMQLFRK